jgi:UDP-N-acetylmuramyl pentapeptide phosphotransferase/UDP-N-acetylglucosamine-1-phosphate transferase
MLYLPLAVWLVLAFFNFRGKIFVGNVGSFGIGMTLSAFAVISDLKFVMLIALLPYVFNSVVILLTYFFKRTKAKVDFDGHRLSSDHRRSLITIMTYHRPMTESRTVALISLLFVVSTTVAVVVHLLGT